MKLALRNLYEALARLNQAEERLYHLPNKRASERPEAEFAVRKAEMMVRARLRAATSEP